MKSMEFQQFVNNQSTQKFLPRILYMMAMDLKDLSWLLI